MKRKLPPLNALRAFEAAARCGTMTAAAAELSVTPGAISRQVAALEAHLGVALFEGSKIQPRLTDAARKLLVGSTAAFDQIESSVEAIATHTTDTIDVACFSTFAVRWLIPRLYIFQSKWPDIQVRLSTGETINESSLSRYDVVISAQTKALMLSATHIRQSVLFPERLGPVLSPSLASRITIRSLDELNQQALLQTKNRLNAWQMWVDAFSKSSANHSADVKLTPDGPEFEHYYFTLEAAIGGLGVAVAPWHLVIDDIHAGRLLSPFGFCESGYVYTAQCKARASESLNHFCNWLTDQARATPTPPPSNT